MRAGGLAPGSVQGRYRVEGMLGRGGMAVVYRCSHVQLGSEHALKVLMTRAPSVHERLLSEGRAQASLRHPNLVAVHDVIDVEGAPGLVMELVEGPTLESWIQTPERNDLLLALGLFRGIVSGVGAAHAAGFVHRDLKPSNVLLQPTPRGWVPKVVDFGLVKARDADLGEGSSRPGDGFGTPQYMSPEQIRDASSVDQRTDIFALGCILYEICTGRRAFDGVSTFEIHQAIISGDYTPPEEHVPDLPRGVCLLIRRLLAVRKQDRPADTAEILVGLYGSDRSIHGGHEVETLSVSKELLARVLGDPTAPPPEAASGPSRLPLLVVFAGSLALGVLVTASLDRAPPTQPVPAEPEARFVVEEGPATPATPPDAASVEKEPAPEPLPERAPEPAAAPVSAPARPGPALAAKPVPPKPPPVETFTVEVSGDADEVWLVGPNGRVSPGVAPAGSYEVRARFGDQVVPSGTIEISADAPPPKLSCAAFAMRCMVNN